MSLKICHISDTHGPKYHTKLNIPECDVLIHSGDIGGRTTILELTEFLIWFDKQPARKKIWIAGNHDIILDKDYVFRKKKDLDYVGAMLLEQQYMDFLSLVKNYNITYLNNTEYTFEGIKFWGSPYTPSFHREYWAFNADRGQEIIKVWSKIPSDVNVLITHGPPFGILDIVNAAGRNEWHKNSHVGCEDLMNVIKRRLFNLKLHTFGHIHDNYGCILQSISNTRKVLFSNGAVLTNEYQLIVDKPLIITI